MCPFCYIGKHHLEAALAQFGPRNNVQITWKSYQLDPTLGADAMDTQTYFQEKKGIPASQSKEMLGNVVQMASNAGLKVDLQKSVITNTKDAHRLIHLAGKAGKADAMKERLFQAHFAEGKHVGDKNLLMELGVEVGLKADDIEAMLDSDALSYDVQMDIQEARNIGVQGVPFFVLNDKYAVSGAQPVAAFLEVLEKSYGEWLAAQPAPALEVQKGPSCTTDGQCD